MQVKRHNKDDRDTGKIADGDGNACNGGETEIIQGVEVGNGLGKRRIPIYDGVFRLY